MDEMKILGKSKIDNDVVDTLVLARDKFPGSSNSLDNLCKKFNIDLSKRKKHNALLDCELLRKVYINLVGEKEPTLVFQNPKIENHTINKNIKAASKKYSKNVIKPSNKELENHRKFLKSELRKNYF